MAVRYFQVTVGIFGVDDVDLYKTIDLTDREIEILESTLTQYRYGNYVRDFDEVNEECYNKMVYDKDDEDFIFTKDDLKDYIKCYMEKLKDDLRDCKENLKELEA